MTVLGHPKEILGVEYAQVSVRARRGCVGLQPPPYASALRPLPGRLLSDILSISQYFSVYLRFTDISGYGYLRLRISQVTDISVISQLYLSYISKIR